MEFKKYLRGVGDAGTRLLFKFRSGTHGLNEELGRHRGREGRKECLLCDAECESVSHVLWDCPAYVSIRSAFMLELRRELGDRFEHFQSLDGFEKSSYVLGSEAWEEFSSGLLGLIKDFVLSVWEERKVRLYGEHANVHQSHSQNDSGDLRGIAGGDGELGCLCGKADTSHLCDGSAHSSGCVVNGSSAMAAVLVIIIISSTLLHRTHTTHTQVCAAYSYAHSHTHTHTQHDIDESCGVGVGTCSFWSCPERQCIRCVCVALRFGNGGNLQLYSYSTCMQDVYHWWISGLEGLNHVSIGWPRPLWTFTSPVHYSWCPQELWTHHSILFINGEQ